MSENWNLNLATMRPHCGWTCCFCLVFVGTRRFSPSGLYLALHCSRGVTNVFCVLGDDLSTDTAPCPLYVLHSHTDVDTILPEDQANYITI